MSRRATALGLGALLAGTAVAARVLWERHEGSASLRVQVLDDPTPGDLSGAPGGFERANRPSARSGGGHLAPPAWEPALLTTLAAWQPTAPSSPLRRLAAYVWAAPLTLAGLLLGVLSGRAPVAREGVLLFPDVGGIPGRVLTGKRFAAAAVGHVILATGTPSRALLDHELVHVRQAERLGPLFPPTYLGLLAVYGYSRHPFERAARRAQGRAIYRRSAS